MKIIRVVLALCNVTQWFVDYCSDALSLALQNVTI